MSDERTAAPAGDLAPLPPSELRAKVKRAQGEGGELRYALALDEPSSASAREASFVWLCVPGVPGCERDFRHLSPYLALSAPVVRLTLPGFGALDDALDAPSTTTERARYIERVIRAEGWPAVHLIGHSMGGPASLLVAGRCPQVRGLYLISSVGLRRHRGMSFGGGVARLLLLLMRLPWLGGRVHKRGQEALWRAGFRAHPLHRAQLRLVIAHVAGLNFEELRRAVERLPSSLYVLCAWAARDPLIEEERFEELAAALPQAQVARFESGGHNPQKFQAAALAQRLIEGAHAVEGGGA